MASLDTMHNIYSSIEKSIRDIFLKTIGEDYVGANQEEGYIEFHWNLPTTDIENFINVFKK